MADGLAELLFIASCGEGVDGAALWKTLKESRREVWQRVAVAARQRFADRDRGEVEMLHGAIEGWKSEVDRLTLLINTPRTDEFFEAVRIEAAHQIERWGVEHDAGKRPEDWIALVVYLLGKATKAHFENDRDKLLHHVITLAAVALNWHRNATGVSTAMRPGVGL